MSNVELTKVCSSCQRELPVQLFNKYKDGFQNYCKECFKIYYLVKKDIQKKPIYCITCGNHKPASDFELVDNKKYYPICYQCQKEQRVLLL